MPSTPVLNETIYVGSAKDLAIQCVDEDGTPAQFLSTDILSAELWQASGLSPLNMQIAIGWNVDGVGLAPPQTGYDQGQVLYRLTNTQSASLSASTTYHGYVYRQLGSDPTRSEMIAHFILVAKGKG